METGKSYSVTAVSQSLPPEKKIQRPDKEFISNKYEIHLFLIIYSLSTRHRHVLNILKATALKVREYTLPELKQIYLLDLEVPQSREQVNDQISLTLTLNNLQIQQRNHFHLIKYIQNLVKIAVESSIILSGKSRDLE